MARQNKHQQQLQRKEAKQKKLLFVLVPVFLALVGFQGPKLYKTVFSSPAPPPAVAAPAVDPGTTTQPAPTPAGDQGALPDTDLPPEPGIDRLIGFSRFTARDPFGPTGPSEPTGGSTVPTTTTGSAQATSAVIDVNGTAETVAVGGSFPASDPAFRLLAVTTDGHAVVGLVSGTFDDGQGSVEVTVGQPLELVADPDGTHYTLQLVSVA